MLSEALVRPRHPRRTLTLALGLGLGAQLLFEGRALGISFPLFAVMLLVAVATTGGREGFQRLRKSLWLAGPLLFFAGMVFVRDSDELTALNVCACGVLALLLVHLSAEGRMRDLRLPDYPRVLAKTMGLALLQPPGLLAASGDLWKTGTSVMKWLKPVGLGLAVSLPVLTLFTFLLASADEVFARLVGHLLDGNPLLFIADRTGSVLLVLGASFVIAGLLAHAHRRRAAGSEGSSAPPVPSRLGFIEGMTVLAAVFALFCAFAAVQASYLFGRVVDRLAEGFTYSAHARSGFFELLAVTALTLLLILGLGRTVRIATAAQQKWLNLAFCAVISTSLLIVASGLQRIELYAEVYGYTVPRLYSEALMVSVGVVLAWRAASLWWRPQAFALGLFVVALGYLACMNLLNPDAFIARHNLASSAGPGRLDLPYLETLSADAWPELKDAASTLAPGNEAEEGWPSFHLARSRRAREQPLAFAQRARGAGTGDSEQEAPCGR